MVRVIFTAFVTIVVAYLFLAFPGSVTGANTHVNAPVRHLPSLKER